MQHVKKLQRGNGTTIIDSKSLKSFVTALMK
jgi:hypothetical protein